MHTAGTTRPRTRRNIRSSMSGWPRKRGRPSARASRVPSAAKLRGNKTTTTGHLVGWQGRRVFGIGCTRVACPHTGAVKAREPSSISPTKDLPPIEDHQLSLGSQLTTPISKVSWCDRIQAQRVTECVDVERAHPIYCVEDVGHEANIPRIPAPSEPRESIGVPVETSRKVPRDRFRA